ncbi:MAG TPA: ATP-binding protein [Solirubrobacterales bacterium]|nr:ATP-binding protein [Solirubrobacterales bacterium]
MTTLKPNHDLPPLVFAVRSHPRSVTDARQRVADYAEAGGADRDDVALAVAESVANAVVHAFGDRDDGAITVRAEIKGARLVVEIADLGSGTTTHAGSPHAGFGLAIIGAVANSVEIRTGNQGTRLVLGFPRAS